MSKVVMSVCALTVAVALTDVVGVSLEPTSGDDLERILSDLQSKVRSLSSLRAECEAEWEVPQLPSGAAVELTVDGDVVRACSEGVVRSIDARPALRTWSWDGLPMNWTMVGDMDRDCTGLQAWSGEGLVLRGRLVPVEESLELLMFVSLAVH